MQALNLQSAMDKFAARTSKVFASVHDSKLLTPTLAKVVITFNSLNHHPEELSKAISKTMDNLASPIEGSFRVIASATLPALVGFVVANREVRDSTDMTNPEKYRVMAANLLMDKADETLWEIKSANDQKFLTRHSTEDLSELLTASTIRTKGTPNIAVIATARIDSSEYVSFIDVASNQLRHGYAVGKGDNTSIKVLCRDSSDGEPIVVGYDFVVQSCLLGGSDIRKEVKAAATGDEAQMKDYYKRLYSYDPEYYSMLEKQISENAAV